MLIPEKPAKIFHRMQNHQKGTSLIEVLVALLILTVGMLSMAALHIASVRYGKVAEYRTTAIQLAEDFGDRMRSNLPGVRNGSYVRTAAWTDAPTVANVPEVKACVGTDETCAPIIAAAVASSDIAQWNNQAIVILPSANLYATRFGTANSTVMDVWVGWLEPSGSTGDKVAEASVNAAYACPAAMKAGADARCMYFRFTL